MSIRRACSVLELDRSTYYYKSRRPDQAGLEARIKEICATRVRYSYRRVHVLLCRERLCSASSDFGAPWLSISQDCVENRQQLSSDGDGCDHLWLFGGDEFVAEVFEDGVVPGCGERAQNSRLRTVLRPPPMKLLPFHWPDWRVHGAGPASAAI